MVSTSSPCTCKCTSIQCIYVQDLTHKLCEALSLAAGCSPLPPSHDSPLHGRPPPPHVGDVQTEPEDFEVVEHSDLHRKRQVYNHVHVYIHVCTRINVHVHVRVCAHCAVSESLHCKYM